MMITAKRLKELVTAPGHISEKDFSEAEKQAKKTKTDLDKFLIQTGLISEEHLGRAIADSFGKRFVDLKRNKINSKLLDIIPEPTAKAQQAIIFEKNGNVLKLATPKIKNYQFFKLIEKKTGCDLEIYYTTASSIQEAFSHYGAGAENEMTKLIEGFGRNNQDEGHIVKLVDLFLEYARDSRASDIHLEPLKKKVVVRFRIDGVLHQIIEYPKALHEQIVFRIKIMASLRTDEHSVAQDGRFSFAKDKTKAKEKFDVRVSVLPITDGENVVMRLLAEYSSRLAFEKLGLTEKDLLKLKNAALKPHGMILVTGPTGSGKTTTLYAVLQILNKPDVNIMTIEDPVEYDVEHIQQTQVNEKKKLTFANGLRSIVRQDPDIIMVGEIRDNETADIAVNAAMTGHLVLSTLHTNDAATTFPRLLEMGIEPFLVASSVNIIIAQRLVRTICGKCKASYVLSKENLAVIEADHNLSKTIKNLSGKSKLLELNLFKGNGCSACGGTGYSGRTGIFEVLELTDEIRALINQKTSSDVIFNKARELGMVSMFEDGIRKVLAGVTSLEEIVRATKK